MAASCVLPLAEIIVANPHLGTRHRAAVGITEQTDAIAIVVSEETGIISMAHNGRIGRHLNEQLLTMLLRDLLKPKRQRLRLPWFPKREAEIDASSQRRKTA